ncbi:MULTISPECIES: winged helix DNA-binding protein [Rhizobium]|uniref:winged helix DNA-binding protein n=1 Tax=Rhizobium TaxID=379 RepID=UPI001B334AAA|nr:MULTISPECIES: winged helix DNA-binding protein [Rhizobium]MBX4906437.1 winged helix DNA-binding protein [Rhizobium bangladeshense]MBX5213535.1 winged helix DNA-binding protein [Rhizobium sp. NLR9a]MBX5219699.1 winged helix DNA-binding protein [Rhizobium sp. NLR8a]MBX5225189.1 winged helix DNA-binding protein [Rhizobium sp. NLR9b]MBX5231051.1 winged helix DNA-binding protein [Rhizobium sp. NLR4a]
MADECGQPEIGPIVSSSHLADGALPVLSELEFGLILAGNAFDRWMVRCMTAAGEPGCAAIDVLVLHSVAHRRRPKRLGDLCSVLGVEDTHLVIYALKKLEKRGLVKSARAGKEKLIIATDKGVETCLRYRAVREALLVESMKGLGLDAGSTSAVAAMLRALSGHYDQAARAAASL